jgi:hypothetical protein
MVCGALRRTIGIDEEEGRGSEENGEFRYAVVEAVEHEPRRRRTGGRGRSPGRQDNHRLLEENSQLQQQTRLDIM